MTRPAIRPIIFSGPMVRALMQGRKFQTRRLASSPLAKCVAGDLLYVRENAYFAPNRVAYAATNPPLDPGDRVTGFGKMRPSIHMPRWASRLTLEVTEVRFQHLWDITEADAVMEGLRECDPQTTGEPRSIWGIDTDEGGFDPALAAYTPRKAFAKLWDSLHDQIPMNRWDWNPDIVALTFTVTGENVDSFKRRRQ